MSEIFMHIIRFIRQMFEDQNGRADEMATLTIIGVLVYFFLETYAVIHHPDKFDAQAFGVGLGAAISAAAVGIGAKSKMEGKEPPK